MIKKTIVVGIVFFVIYTILTFSIMPDKFVSQHQWQSNIITAQKFIYDDMAVYNNVIIGSSLSNRLVIDSLPKTFNLSFSGQSIYDGLNILSHKTNLPKNVFIEMNIALRGKDENFASAIFSPVLYYLRKLLPSLRDGKQPIGILGGITSSIITRPFIEGLKNIFQLNEESATNMNKKELFSKMLLLEIKNYSQCPSQKTIKGSFDSLDKLVSQLENRGVNIVFFEIPVNSKLNNLPRAKTIRSAFYSSFPSSIYNYISIPDSCKFETTDGLHLNEDEALRYTMYLKSKLFNYLSY